MKPGRKRMLPYFLLFLIVFMPIAKAYATGCADVPVTISGESLSPLLRDGTILMMRPISCVGGVKRGNAIVFQTGVYEKPVIKIARALPGDRFNISKDGFIHVNGDVLRNSAGHPYLLHSSRRMMLDAYWRQYNGVVPGGTYLLLGDGSPDVIDSTRLGLIHSSNFIMVGDIPVDPPL